LTRRPKPAPGKKLGIELRMVPAQILEDFDGRVDQAISPLRRRMIEDMTIREFLYTFCMPN
jgi:hypothetical protein